MKQAVANVETELNKAGKKLNSRVSGPLAQSYKPELDTSELLDAKSANYYQKPDQSIEVGGRARVDRHQLSRCSDE